MTPASAPGEFNIEVLKLMDREVAPLGYNLTLKATDNGKPPRYTLLLFHIATKANLLKNIYLFPIKLVYYITKQNNFIIPG